MPPSNPQPVIILLATFNGEKFLPEQLNSIINQSHQDWILLTRDDSSTDKTPGIIQKYAQTDERIQILRDDKGPSGSSSKNFNYLMEAALKTDAELFFFCDQDDIWHPDKIKLQTREFTKMNRHQPCLIHHDLEVVDVTLKQIDKSFFHLQRLNPNSASFNNLLCRNEITGCAIACNKNLLEYAVPIPEQAVMHDWWLALICSGTGQINVLNEPLIQYRQHADNAVGAKYIHRLQPFSNWHKNWLKGNLRLHSTILQAHTLQEQLQKKSLEALLSPTSLQGLQSYTNILQMPRIQRVRCAQRLSLVKSYWLLDILHYFRLLTI